MTAIRGTDEVENHDAYIAGSDRKYLIITMAIISVAYLISMSTDCLGIVLELNGILAAVPLAYVLPALCYLKLEEGPLLSPKKLPALGLLMAGIFAAVSGLLLLIFNNTSSASCAHGGVMAYCQPSNLSLSNASSSSFGPTSMSTPLTSLMTQATTKVATIASTTAASTTAASTIAASTIAASTTAASTIAASTIAASTIAASTTASAISLANSTLHSTASSVAAFS
jgi:hypothetical protein